MTKNEMILAFKTTNSPDNALEESKLIVKSVQDIRLLTNTQVGQFSPTLVRVVGPSPLGSKKSAENIVKI